MRVYKNKGIPWAREKILEIAEDLDDRGECLVAFRLRIVELRMWRKYIKTRAKPTARRVTANIRDDVLEYLEEFPETSNRDIGRVFGIDGGRVTEILQGKYRKL